MLIQAIPPSLVTSTIYSLDEDYQGDDDDDSSDHSAQNLIN